MGLLGFLRRGKGAPTAGDEGEGEPWERPLDKDAVPLPPLPPLTPRPPRPSKPPVLDDDDRDVFRYVRNMTSTNVWYYRDRLSTPRGPCPLPVLRQAWVAGVIDEDTLVWGQGLMDWLPIRNVRTLVPQIRTREVQFATWLKRKLVIEPALAAVRKQRAEHRPDTSLGQEKWMQ